MKGLYKIILLIIVPLLVAFGIGSFAYNNNTAGFASDFISKAGYKNTEGETERYLDFATSAYDKYYSQEVKSENDVKLFDLVVYRWFDIALDEEEIDYKSTTYKYAFVLQNINYGEVYYSIYKRDDKQHRFEYLPTFKLTISDLGDEDEDKRDTTEVSFADNTDTVLSDYNFVGYTNDEGVATKRTYSGIKISTPSTKWANVAVDSDFTSNIEVLIKATDAEFPGDEDATIEVAKIELTDYNQKVKDLVKTENGYTYASKELTLGYEKDIYEAGYFGYVFGKYIWWQALIAIVLTLIVTGSTVLVWEAEAKKEQEAQTKREKLKNKK